MNANLTNDALTNDQLDAAIEAARNCPDVLDALLATRSARIRVAIEAAKPKPRKPATIKFVTVNGEDLSGDVADARIRTDDEEAIANLIVEYMTQGVFCHSWRVNGRTLELSA